MLCDKIEVRGIKLIVRQLISKVGVRMQMGDVQRK